ncbi:MAG: diphthine--ammonia ligase [Thermoprotei archaeon]|nr:MAG: diphthine--ammonia ligase [Thermoprotei archaeon]
MKAAVLFTGGKDSTYALHLSFLQGYDVVALASIIPRYEDSTLYHKPFLEVLKLQAESIGLPLEIEEATTGEEGGEIRALYRLLARVRDRYGVKVVVSGAVLSDYQRLRFTMVAENLGLISYTPIWRIPQDKYLLEIVDAGLEFMLVSISAYGLPPTFLGKIINKDDALEIIRLAKKYGFNPAFEGGEAETLVIYAPLFRRRVVIEGYADKRGTHNYVYVVKNAYLD